MAEDTTSDVASEAPSTEQAQPTSPAPQSQPAVPASAPAEKPVNLFELPQFREYQSAQSRREQERERAYQQQQQQMAARLKELETRDLSDEQRLAYEVRERDEYIARLEQERQVRLERENLERQKFEDLRLLSEATGVPMQDLFEAQDRNHAAQLAKQKLQARLNQRTPEQEQAVREAMRPDLGSGARTPAASERSKALQKHLKEGNSYAFYERILKDD